MFFLMVLIFTFLITFLCSVDSPCVTIATRTGLGCGDLNPNAANSVIAQSINAGGGGAAQDAILVDPIISDLVSQLARIQGTERTIIGDDGDAAIRPVRGQTSLLNPPREVSQSRRRVSDTRATRHTMAVDGVLHDRTRRAMPMPTNSKRRR